MIIHKNQIKNNFGEVIHSRCNKCGEEVAIKVFSAVSIGYGNQEVETLKATKGIHGVVELIAHFVQDGKMHIVMKICEGGNVNQVRQNIGNNVSFTTRSGKECWKVVPVLAIAYHMLSVLKTLHDKRILHKDIKPKNMLFPWKFFPERPYVSESPVILGDVGLAYVGSPGATLNTTANMSATPGFIAPELYRLLNKPPVIFSPATDIWALGATLLYLLTKDTLGPDFKHVELKSKLTFMKFPNEEGRKVVETLLVYMMNDDPAQRANVAPLFQYVDLKLSASGWRPGWAASTILLRLRIFTDEHHHRDHGHVEEECLSVISLSSMEIA